jgi:hypothetical protein
MQVKEGVLYRLGDGGKQRANSMSGKTVRMIVIALGMAYVLSGLGGWLCYVQMVLSVKDMNSGIVYRQECKGVWSHRKY